MADVPHLNEVEARVLGVLIEKELTVPDQVPLSLNAATSGSNQKSNRDPVVAWSEAEVHVGLQGLVAKHLVGRNVAQTGRVEKWRQGARETLGVTDAELAVLAELLMRGPQTQGELRQRASRMVKLPSLDALQEVLGSLIRGGLARRIGAAPGSRAERYEQRLAPDLHGPQSTEPAPGPQESRPKPLSSATPAAPTAGGGLGERVARLEAEVERMRKALEELGAFE